MKKITSFLLFLVIAQGLFGQTFTPDREKFVKEFSKTLSDYGQGDFNDLSKKLLPELLLESGKCSDKQLVKIVSSSNLILEKKLKPYPELYNYVFSVYSLLNNGQNEASFNAFHETVDKMLASRNVKRFSDLMDLTAGFFSESVITQASNFKWYYEGGTYSFGFEESPIIQFEGGNLICRVINRDAKGNDNPYADSLVVLTTTGSFDPLLKKWAGTGGMITWEKVGLSKNETFATLSKYEVALKSSNFQADSVTLRTPYFNEPIQGELAERAFVINREDDRVYPQFNSYSKDLKIDQLRKDLNFKGGVSLRGAAFEGVGPVDNQAVITLFNEGKPFIVAESQLFFVDADKIFSKTAKIYLTYAKGDSITHPGAEFSYEPVKETVELRRTKLGIGQAPFSNSYHQLDMYIPKLTWNVGSDSLLISFDYGMSQEQRISRLESKNYFDGRLYDQLQGLASIHPLVGIVNYAEVNGRINLNDGKLASSMGKTLDQAKITLFELANLGFISYDAERHLVDVNQKTFNFVMARSGQMDYDNIAFVSDMRPKRISEYTEDEIAKDQMLTAVKLSYDVINKYRSTLKNFGSIHLKNYDLFLEAVDEVPISQAQLTSVFPRSNKLTILKNRDFEFKGFINAGKIDCDVEVSKFIYDDFKFDIDESNKTRLRVRPMRKEDGNRAITMISELSKIVGEIQVDDPTNRSGRNKQIKGYPKLTSETKSFIYYNSKDIYKGAYDSTRFYYTVEPFLMDSLDDFDENTFSLQGELTSAGIFPKFKQDIKIMPDYSFGFSTKAPEKGFPFYSNGATFENKIVLSGNGLQGAGTIKYLNSTSISKALAFLPDSTIGLAEFTNKQSETGIQYPQVYGKEVFITYIPQGNVLKAASNIKHDLDFFNDQAKLKGTAYLTPQGMRGRGLMNFLAASLVSKDFSYKCYDILGDTTEFTLRNAQAKEGEEKIAFHTENVNANVSFKERKGSFKSNDGAAIVEFPINKFICKMDEFNWYMDKDQIEMESKTTEINTTTGVDLVAPNFFSTNNRRDTLAFHSAKSSFNLNEKTIYCDEVEYVNVADARVFPSDKKVIIRQEAKIDPMSNTKIVANYITKYHTFVQADVEIVNRKYYKASGVYPFYDRDSNVTLIQMDNIGLDSSYQTVANGKVPQELNFKLSDEFAFYGNVNIVASNPYVNFQGATKVFHDCEKFTKSWLSFSAPINPQDIQIPVSNEMKNLEGERISAGVVWRDSPVMDSIRIYPTFLSALVSETDPVMLTASGVLRYDKVKSEYQIGPKAKFLNPNEKGNIISLNTKTCALSGSGLIDMGMDYGPAEVASYGDLNYDQTTGETKLKLTMKVKMDVDKKMFQDIGIRLATTPATDPMELDAVNLEKAILEWEDEKVADKFKSDYNLKGEIKKLPDALADGLVFTGIELRSFEKVEFQERGLITTRHNAVLVNTFEQPVFKYVDFDLFLMQTFSEISNDKLMLYFGLSGGRIYYLDYTMMRKEGELRMISSDKDFMTAVNAVKEDKRKSKNFKWGMTDQNIYIARFNRLLGKREE